MFCLVVLTMVSSLVSQTVLQNVPQATPRANRITQELAAGEMVTMPGSVHPLTRRAADLGAVHSQMPLNSLTLNVGLSSSQQQEMDALLEAQQNPKSPLYHQWLTQEEYGTRFGLTDADLNAVTGWLTSQGFTVGSISKSRNAIHFRGNVWLAESAFHTQLHRFQVNGKEHIANTTELRVPAAIGNVILNVRGLNSFRLEPQVRKVTPEFTLSAGDHFLTPGDWAMIYNVNAIYDAGYDGTGAHVGVVGQTYAPQADIDRFRSAAGLTATKLAYTCIDPTTSHCTGNSAISTAGDLGEADLDIEWAGGIAKNATVHFVYAPYSDVCSNSSCTNGIVDSVTGNTYDVFDALQHAVEDYKVPATGKVLPVISMSYIDCEASLVGNSSYVDWVSSVGKQANSQGQTIVVASGDSGPAGCDAQGVPANGPAQGGAWATVPGNSPNYTSVGGTTINASSSQYWNQALDQVVTALGYMPEAGWNDTSYVNGLGASGGGVSAIFPQPTWQQIPYGFTGTPGRFVPDVAFAASPNTNGYMFCSQEENSAQYGTMCANNSFWSSASGNNSVFYVIGGTSAGTPSFAGMLTLLTQKYGPQGNLNPTLYNMALNTATYATVFHDITSGNNEVPCVAATLGCVLSDSGNSNMGWNATTGYDLVTGLGSIDGGALYAAMGAPLLPATTTSVTETVNSLIIGHTTSFKATVTSSGSGTMDGTVTFKVGGTPIGTAPVSGGAATLNNVTVSAANGFSVGTDTITAVYGGSTNSAASIGSTTLTVLPLQGTTTTITATPNSLMALDTTTLTATVASTLPGTITGTVTFLSAYNSTTPFTLGTATVSGGVATLTVTASTANFLSSGSSGVMASYSGDANFTSSSGTTTLSVTPLPSETTVTVTPNPVLFNNPANLNVTVSSSKGTPLGYVTFTAGGIQFADTYLSLGGTATWTAFPITAQSGFSVGANTVTAHYYQSGDYASSTGTMTLTVTPQPATTTTLSISANSVGISGTVSLTSTVTSTATGTPTGTVYFRNGNNLIGGASLSNGTATLANYPVDAAHGFAAGLDSITANYAGDLNFASSASAVTKLTVIPIGSATSITASSTSVKFGDSIRLTALVSGSAGLTPGGTVAFTAGGVNLGNYFMAGGSVQTNMILVSPDNGFSVGSTAITATYSGDGNFNPSSASNTLTVASALPFTVTPSTTAVSLAPGGSASVQLSVASAYYAGVVTMATNSNSPAVLASAPSVTVNGGGLAYSTLTITATASAGNKAPPRPWKSGGAVVFCAVLLGAPFSRRRRHRVAALLMTLAISLAAFMVACGGSGGGGSTSRQPRTYSIIVTPTGTGVVTNPAPVVITVTVQ